MNEHKPLVVLSLWILVVITSNCRILKITLPAFFFKTNYSVVIKG